MFRKAGERLFDVYYGIETSAAVYASALLVLGWGAQMANPLTDVFVLYESQLGYLSSVIDSEIAWGMWGIFSGLLAIVAYEKRRKGLCVFGLQSILFFRLLTFISIALRTSFSGTGMYDFIAWVLLSLFAIAKVRAEGWN